MLGAALHKPPAGFADIPISRRSRSGPLWAAPVLPLMVPSSRRTVPGNDAFHGAKSRRQGPVPLLRKWHTVIGRGDVPPPGKGPAAPGEVREAAMSIWPGTHSLGGAGTATNREILPPPAPRRVRDSLPPPPPSPWPCGPERSWCPASRSAGRCPPECQVPRRELPAVGAPVAQHPSGFGRQDVHPSAARAQRPPSRDRGS